MLKGLGVGVRSLQNPGRFANDFFRLVAHHSGEGLIDVDNVRTRKLHRLGFSNDHSVVGINHHRFQQSQPAFLLFPFRNIFGHRDNPIDLSSRIAHRDCTGHQPAYLPIGRKQSIGDFGRMSSQRLTASLKHGLEIARMNLCNPVLKRSHFTLRTRLSQYGLASRTDVHHSFDR